MIAGNEKLRLSVYVSSLEASIKVAQEIASEIRERQKTGANLVLGLVGGSSPLAIYAELVRLHKVEGLSFSNVVSFSIDEFCDTDITIESYLYNNLFSMLDVKLENIHYPTKDVEAYEALIAREGGIDMLITGVGREGQLGHNEAGTNRFSRTRIVKMNPLTRYDAAGFFGGEDNVPYTAVTMGVATILEARKIYLFAWGEAKAAAVYDAVEGGIRESVPVTFLQYHQNLEALVDEPAASKLSRIQAPWLMGTCEWNDRLIRKALIWLCLRLKKPLLKLTDRDYQNNSMAEIIENSSAYDVNIKVFNDLQHTITGWPGGKPNADDTQRPERRDPAIKRVVVFSPHPDDDVISMGGTLSRLAKQGHDVHVAYQTSGNTAVSDSDVFRYIEFIKDANTCFGAEEERLNDYLAYLNGDHTVDVSPLDIRNFKGRIRRGEAKAACRYINIPSSKLHFLDLPFYETGAIKKGELSSADTAIIKELLREVKPHQIFAAGDLSDPHGTHRNCMKAILMAIDEMAGDEWLNDCNVWLYRGAWQEWNVEDVDMAVPLSPDEVLQKRISIFKHQSQKDGAMFPGTDSREFWQRAEDRNHNTAVIYDKLGLSEYEAMEVFVKL